MYDLPYYKEKDAALVLEFMRQHPFAFLTGVNEQQQPVATQVPVLMEEREGQLFLQGHIMRQTDHHRAFLHNPQALVVFTGPHTYVSASWYDNKQQGSTWNYMSVHARGTIHFKEEAVLRNILARTTSHFENDPSSGANYKDLPADYIDRLVKAIVAFEIEVTGLNHVFKLSQNRNQASYDAILQKLEEQGGDGAAIAAEMQQRRSQLFKPGGSAE